MRWRERNPFLRPKRSCTSIFWKKSSSIIKTWIIIKPTPLTAPTPKRWIYILIDYWDAPSFWLAKRTGTRAGKNYPTYTNDKKMIIIITSSTCTSVDARKNPKSLDLTFWIGSMTLPIFWLPKRTVSPKSEKDPHLHTLTTTKNDHHHTRSNTSS